MLRYLQIAAFEALRTLRGNLLHTLLSTLGIVIGVAALVSILALGDGMEKFGREQVASTTDLNAILVTPNIREKVDGLWVKKENPVLLLPADARALKPVFSQAVTVAMQSELRGFLHVPGDTLKSAALVTACLGNTALGKSKIAFGRMFVPEDTEQGDSVLLINRVLAENLSASGYASDLLGQKLLFQDVPLRVVGILENGTGQTPPHAFLPIRLLNAGQLKESPAVLVVTAEKTEDVPAVKNTLQTWLDEHKQGGKEGFEIITNDFRVAQMRKAILVFKLVMGLIVGIAILVGGIGIMNVMLMSVTERTREIGIRKAMGAKRKAIGLQFIAEALAISLLGCGLGLVLGIAFMAVAAPLIRHYAEVTGFQASFSLASFLVIALVAVLIGIAFGAVPAWKAAKLSPVEAMRHE